jgi:hypothetical protein
MARLKNTTSETILVTALANRRNPLSDREARQLAADANVDYETVLIYETAYVLDKDKWADADEPLDLEFDEDF